MLLNDLTPTVALLIVAAVTLAASALSAHLCRARQRSVAALAREWDMHYTPRDIFNLAPRLAARLPVAGASDVVVRDLIYGAEPAGHRYILCAQYTVGVVRAKTRRSCVLSLVEPRRRTDENVWNSLRFAPEDLPLLDQYRSLHARPEKTNAER